MIKPGTKLDRRYRLVEHIAKGGMGDVWQGWDETMGRKVAIKILLPSLLDQPGFSERFRREARAMAVIDHRGVVQIYDVGTDRAVGAYLVMEYVEGDPLSRTLARVGRLTPARTMAIVAQAAEALAAVHKTGVVHRDVKPGNLLVRPNGTVVLTDFGIARAVGASQLTAPGSVLGTASYISPEVAMGELATPLSDVYALGVVAYHCLAGRRPYDGESPMEIATRHVNASPPPLPRDVPPSVTAIVERAMARQPSARWPNAAAFAAVARRTAGELGVRVP
jgi:serine/threonine-protein kinase